jgi:hypothetical protein
MDGQQCIEEWTGAVCGMPIASCAAMLYGPNWTFFLCIAKLGLLNHQIGPFAMPNWGFYFFSGSRPMRRCAQPWSVDVVVLTIRTPARSQFASDLPAAASRQA